MGSLIHCVRNKFTFILLLFVFGLGAQINLDKPNFDAVQQENPTKIIASVLIDSTINFFDFAVRDSSNPELYELSIAVKDIPQLNLYFNESVIPAGAALFIKNEGRSNFFRFNSENLNAKLATQPLLGDEVTIQYFGSQEGASLVIGEIGCFLKSTSEIQTSSYCQVDVNCSEGSDWQDQKKGVVRLLLKAGSFSVYCTGSLINNTARDCKPYLFSSEHCLEDVNSEGLDQTIIYFNYEASVCEANDGNSTQNMQGLSLKAFQIAGDGSDFALFELKDNIPLEYSPYFNGWNRMETAPSNGSSIHHPSGDIKKISTFSSLLSTANISDLPDDFYWEVTWAETPNGHGVTEVGSSGSPLFNNEKLIIGNLTGGTSFCSKPNDPDYYGKFAIGWEGGVDSTRRLDVWLDPLSTGEEKIPGSYFPCSDTLIQYLPIDSVAILGNPVGREIKLYLEQKISSEIHVDLFSEGGKLVYIKDYNPTNIANITIPVFNLRNGVYFLRIKTDAEERIEKIVVLH